MSSQPRQSAPTPSTETSSAPDSSQQVQPNTGYERDPERYAELEAEYLRDARDDPRGELAELA